ncbi:uncharacterized protein LOC111614938 isoform X1 [Centruroides sculpturatus]|uniref:uncharacterized protein LOC111614938 isoform X1 n=1 Tax=Centruroides sculpturatus TaxID=218467 RepID=UPI000C6DBE8A|nr:uncharacterized protein LOC111614938 isoform X1 [Centruroides sculpturatus]
MANWIRGLSLLFITFIIVVISIAFSFVVNKNNLYIIIFHYVLTNCELFYGIHVISYIILIIFDIGITLEHEVSLFCTVLEEQICDKKKINYRYVIARHVQFCDILSDFDDIVSFFSAIYYLFQLALTSLSVYNGVIGNGSTIIKCTALVDSVFSMLVFFILTLATTKLPKTMHRIRPILELLFFYEEGLEDKLKIISYRKRLGKAPIGITVAGIFTITKKSIPKTIQAMYSSFTSLLNVKNQMNACDKAYKHVRI